MSMEVLNKNFAEEAKKLSISEDELHRLIKWAQTHCGAKRLLHAMGLGNFHPEHDEWEAYSDAVDVNFYINEHNVMKAFAYPVENGQVQTDGELEVILVSVSFSEE